MAGGKQVLAIPEDKVIIGLTGNIATGKSAVLRLAAEQGALAIDADKIVHEILDGDADVQEAVAALFGAEVRLPDGRINRPALGRIVFDNSQALQDLESIIHPAVQQQVARRINESQAAVVMIEAIKLLEGNLRLLCRQIWVTVCSRQRQMERLLICRGLDEKSAAARIDAQSSQEDKVAQADVVIDTNGLFIATQQQFEQAWFQLLGQ